MKVKFTQLKLSVWNKLIKSLKDLKRKCREKDKIIEALEAQLKMLKDSFTETKNI